MQLGFAASTPARADFSVVRFELGFCRIWWNNGVNPIGEKGQVQVIVQVTRQLS
jgi:hypothetical protein